MRIAPYFYICLRAIKKIFSGFRWMELNPRKISVAFNINFLCVEGLTHFESIDEDYLNGFF